MSRYAKNMDINFGIRKKSGQAAWNATCPRLAF